MHDLGKSKRASLLWKRALRRNPEHAEALVGLALTRLEDDVHRAPDDTSRRTALLAAAGDFAVVRALDPGLDEGWIFGAAVEAARGDCDRARSILSAWKNRPCWIQRRFPAETGTGAGHSASIGRRRMVKPRTSRFDPDRALGDCRIELDRVREIPIREAPAEESSGATAS
jgi:hypothetical protein